VAVLIVSEPKVLRYAAVEIPSLTPADNPVDAAFGFPQAEAAAYFFWFTPASRGCLSHQHCQRHTVAAQQR
jgi:hypothetical protein